MKRNPGRIIFLFAMTLSLVCVAFGPAASAETPGSWRNPYFLTAEESAALQKTNASTGSNTGAVHAGGNPNAGSANRQPFMDKRIGEASIGNCKEWVNVRGDASTKKDPIDRIDKNTNVEVLSWDVTAKWARILYNDGNNAGWVNYRFIVFPK